MKIIGMSIFYSILFYFIFKLIYYACSPEQSFFSSQSQTKNDLTKYQKYIKTNPIPNIAKLSSAQIGSGWSQINQMIIIGAEHRHAKIVNK